MNFFGFKKSSNQQMQEVPLAGEGENMPRRYDTMNSILSDRTNRSKYTFYDENNNNLGEIEDIAHNAAPGIGAEKTYHFSNARDRTFNDMSPLYVKGPTLKVPPTYAAPTPYQEKYDSPSYGGRKSRRTGKRRRTRRSRKGGRKSRRMRRH